MRENSRIRLLLNYPDSRASFFPGKNPALRIITTAQPTDRCRVLVGWQSEICRIFPKQVRGEKAVAKGRGRGGCRGGLQIGKNSNERCDGRDGGRESSALCLEQATPHLPRAINENPPSHRIQLQYPWKLKDSLKAEGRVGWG
ncbi:hypothetical protein CEXT_124061 [Caerostris extrusa]|uniref:Uncharacterized protein n=1 Tax=Caerostris extrusa TaxID=172846 RepID=A0AAV4MIR9_CAEEX|nr:hypothetical protein CEXT_124061 [Caerostris extrusa]